MLHPSCTTKRNSSMRSHVAVALLSLLALPAFAGDAILLRNGEPIFIPASRLLAPNGAFAANVPEGWQNWHMREGVRRGAELCATRSLGETDVEVTAPRHTAALAVENAKAIFTGTIAEVTQGLFVEGPATLLRIEHLAALKQTASYAKVTSNLFARYPYASFIAGDREYCRKAWPEQQLPKAGDRVIVFAFEDPADDGGSFVYSVARDIIVEPAHGDAHVPKELEFFAGSDKNMDSVAASISRIIHDWHLTADQRR
jgi:hypothetical protein